MWDDFFFIEWWLMAQICIDGRHPRCSCSDLEISVSLTP
jgi:hypothetical protein